MPASVDHGGLPQLTGELQERLTQQEDAETVGEERQHQAQRIVTKTERG
jgi:hypothetical protein